MLYARKCPKCKANIQTKIIRKAIGLGFVEIPVAQFCLNPACDWYQDFAEAKMTNEIKEEVLQIKLPSITKKLQELKKPSPKDLLLLMGIFIVIIVVLFVISIVQFNPEPSLKNPSSKEEFEKSDQTPLASITPGVTATMISAPAVTATPVFTSINLPVKYPVRIDVSHGFNPPVININNSDIITWINEENQRTRVILVSKDGLFENKVMAFSDKYSYQFNLSGVYTFVLSEYDPWKQASREYPNATGKVNIR